MKYVFILNPAAGKDKKALGYVPLIQKIRKERGISEQIYISKSGEDIIKFVSALAETGDEYRIYAFGGDGTLNKVVNGCAGKENVEVGVFPMGTGNDFIKSTPFSRKDYLDVNRQMDGESRRVDLIRYDGKYCINMCNMGFDARVAIDMPSFKKIPFVSNKAAYNLALVKNLTGRLGRYIEVEVDGKPYYKGEAAFCCAGNGISAGGGFYMTPKARTDDGLIDLCIVDVPPLIRRAHYTKCFSLGTQLDDPVTKDTVHYTQCSSFSIKATEDLALVNDGEGEYIRRMSFEIVPLALRFITPSKEE